MTLVFVDVPIKIKNALDQRIADVFLTYDFVGNYMIANENIVHVLRFLGCVPTNRDVVELIKLAEFSDIRGAIHLSRFLAVLVEWLERGRMRPATIEQLEAAFKLIDPLNRKYVTEEELREALVDAEYEPFDDEEKAELLRTTVERPSGLCWYEKFIYKLSSTPKDCIYSQAAELAADREAQQQSK